MAAPTRRALAIFGANTDVGKTLCSAGLVLAGLRRSGRAAYLKPLQTGVGGPDEGDAALVRRCAVAATGAAPRCETLHAWPEPVSPHVAAAGGAAPSDAALAAEIDRWVRAADEATAVVETAGGVLSPSAAGGLQADVFAALDLPTLLVGDARLGGVSTTLTALECLRSRGAAVGALVFVGGDAALGNAAYVASRPGAPPVFSLAEPPPLPAPLDGWLAAEAAQFDAALAAVVGGES